MYIYLLLNTKWVDVTIGDDPSEEPIWVISSHSPYEIVGEGERSNEDDAQERGKGERSLHYSPSLGISLLLDFQPLIL